MPRGHPLPAEEIAALQAALVDMLNYGMTQRAAATALGVTEGAVGYHANILRERGLLIGPVGRPTYKESHSKPECDTAYVAKTRHCLMCGGRFISDWPGARVCVRCKGTSAWRTGT